MPCAVIYFCSKHRYADTNCSGLDPTNTYVLFGFNTGG